MFKPNTLFIVGAGASAEVGLPLGATLLGLIEGTVRAIARDELTGQIVPKNNFVRELLRRYGQDSVRPYERAKERMIRGIRSAESVDRFIDRYRDDEYISKLGKAAIVRIISFKERKSDLATDDGHNDQPPALGFESWYWTFAKALFSGVARDQIESVFDNISIVCFNYDRCIEHFLTCELMRSFDIDIERASKILSKLNIWHPYGTIAPLKLNDINGVGFGEHDRVSGQCFELAARIKTFTEKHEDRDMIDEIRRKIEAAETVVFLGFGFYQENLDLIQPDYETGIKRVLATGHGLSDSDKAEVKNRLSQWSSCAPDKIEITDAKCAKFLEDYRMALCSQ